MDLIAKVFILTIQLLSAYPQSPEHGFKGAYACLFAPALAALRWASTRATDRNSGRKLFRKSWKWTTTEKLK